MRRPDPRRGYGCGLTKANQSESASPAIQIITGGRSRQTRILRSSEFIRRIQSWRQGWMRCRLRDFAAPTFPCFFRRASRRRSSHTGRQQRLPKAPPRGEFPAPSSEAHSVGSRAWRHRRARSRAPDSRPVVAALAGAGAAGAVAGIAGALIGMGTPEWEAKRYEGRINSGNTLLSVHLDNSKWSKRAKDILARTGAQDTSSSGEASADFAASDRPMPRTARGGPD